VIVATVDFEYVPLSKHGTASFAHRWVDGSFVLIHSSYWWWGTEVSSDITADTTWTTSGNPYYVTTDITIESGVSLTIESGTDIRFRKITDNYIGIDVYGSLICQGASFTTSCDFENYDRSQDYGDWKGIWVMEDGGCSVENSLLEYANWGIYVLSDIGTNISGCMIRKCSDGIRLREPGTHTLEDNIISNCSYAIMCNDQTSATSITGNSISFDPSYYEYGSYGIYCWSSSPVISSNTISGNFYYGIRCYNNSSPDINSNTISGNYTGIYCMSGSSPTIHNNNIAGNYYGLTNNDSMIIIDAENNWWGDASGPYHPTLNPGGLGDEVSDDVDFDPWLTSVVTVSLFGI
jgi:parallel beta-helix repeat protein